MVQQNTLEEICYKFFACSYSKKLSMQYTLKVNAITMWTLHKSQGGHSHTLPIRVCAAQRGCDFEAPDLERGIHFRGVF